ncbi:MAG: hypothetical protein IPM42_07350 [Saprospiraceae bacterium]|nr:hypothetical protein [Saprospiraceae bacterium]
MIDENKRYPAKILLFGEYTVTKGSTALAIPLHLFSGRWTTSKHNETISDTLLHFSEYLAKQILPQSVQIDTKAFTNNVNKGLKFDSDIPMGYGLGSSGSLVAATANKYVSGLKNLSLTEIKSLLGLMESFFHGNSSGIDPLVSYLNQTVIISANGETEIISHFNYDSPNFDFFLLDTCIPRQTAPLVKTFHEKYNNQLSYAEKVTELSDLNQEAIQHCIYKEWRSMFESFSKISALQLNLFNEMIPEDFKNIWSEGLRSKYFKLKLCGAGGGGMILGFTENYKLLCETYPEFKFLRL